MKNLLTVMLALILLALLPSCAAREGRHRMDLVDSLINDQPDSALKLLLAIPANQHRRGANEARYNMLLTEAAYKSDGITLPDSINPLLTDSIICISVSYYELHGEPADKARARYLAGIVDYEKGLYDKALVHFLRADKFESGENNPKLKGLINRGIGWCLAEYYDVISAVKYHKISYKWFMTANEPLFAAYELANIAYNYESLNDHNMVMLYSGQLEKYAIDNNNLGLLTCSLLARGGLYVKLNQYDKAVEMYEKIPDVDNLEINENNYMLMGKAYLLEGNVEKAIEFNNKIKTKEPAMNEIVLNMLARENKYKALTDTLMHSLAIVDSIRNSVWTRNNIATINEYYRSEEDKNVAIAQSLRNRNWFIAIIASLLVIMVVVIYYLRTATLKKKLYQTLSEASNLRKLVDEKDIVLVSADSRIHEKEENIEHLNRDVHSLCEDIYGLNENICRLESDNSALEKTNSELRTKLKMSELKEEQMESIINRMQQEVHKVLISRYSQIDNLMRDYNEAEGSKSEQEKVFKKVRTLVNDFKSNPEVVEDMEFIINTNMGDLITRFRKDFPRFKKTNINMFIFLVLGLSYGTIAILQSCSIDAVYTRKSKLKKIIECSKNPNSATYLRYISISKK